MSQQDSSSSDDETQFRSNINIPNFTLKKKQQKPYAKRPLAKAGKRLKQSGKSVRFPDSHQQLQQQQSNRHSMISNSTRNDDSSDSEFSVADSGSVEGAIDPSLPSFNKIQSQGNIKSYSDDEDDDDEEVGNEDDDSVDPLAQPASKKAAAVHPNPQFYETDSSDESSDEVEQQKEQEQARAQHQPPAPYIPSFSAPRRPSQSSSSMARKNSQHSQGTDITDQRDEVTSARSGNSEERSGIKSLLRRMTLSDIRGSDEIEDVPSASDTFLGRVLSFSQQGGQSLGGGGLMPGASHRTGSQLRNIDEESEIGLDPEDPQSEAIELKRMDFAKLSEEAHNLISVHVPDAKKMMRQLGGDTIHEHQSEDGEKLPEGELLSPSMSHDANGETDNEDSSSHLNEFLAPNPDLFLRGEGRTEEGDDYMMLDEDVGDGYIAPPKQVHAGVLSSLLKLYQNPQEAKSSSTFATGGSTLLADEQSEFSSYQQGYDSKHSTVDFSKIRSGIKKGPKMMTSKIPGFKKKNRDVSSSSGDSPNNEKAEGSGADSDDMYEGGLDEEGRNLPSFQNARPKAAPKKATNVKVPKFHKKNKRNKLAEQLRITVHIADILQRQRFILRMCKALMLYGAPTHRLEEYMTMTSRVLEIDGQFIYFPGCMIVAFGDATTRTSEVHLVRCAQGLNLSKLSDTHKIYKSVIHDLAGVEEAAVKLEELLKRKNQYNPLICVFLYGLGSSMVTPFAFGGGWYDIPISFIVGCCVGYLQFFVSSKSNLYSSVFEVTSSIVVSFIARGIGSIKGGHFCFAAIAQGSLALILPGYIILCGSLELQSRNIVAGSVRMFYAIIYSLFLGFGITLGAALYGWVDKNSTSDSQCPAGHNMNAKYRILFVPMFSMCLGLINQARWRQLPVMVAIAGLGYVANYFAGKHFNQVTEFTAAIGSFVVGILGNMYSRIWKGMAVSAMLPAIFVLVPSGIASQSTLLTGIATANQITDNKNQTTTATSSSNDGTGALSFGATMVEVSIGISVGLFAAALVVYPFGKKRTGLFTL